MKAWGVNIDMTVYAKLMRLVLSVGRLGQVLEGIWAGKGTKEIGAELGISPKTVEYHRARLYRLFGVENPVSLCRRAIALGVIRPETDFTAKNSESAEILNHG